MGNSELKFTDPTRRASRESDPSDAIAVPSCSLLDGLSPRRLVVGVVAISVIWRLVVYGLAFPIWGDEAFLAINFITRDFGGMIAPLDYGQIAPLGYCWAQLLAARFFGLSEWSLRLVALLCGTGALLLFPLFAFRVVPRRAAMLATAIFAASYYLCRHSAEVKPYATDLLVSLMLTMTAHALLARPDSLIRWCGLVALGAISVWCSYPAAFVAGGIGLALTGRMLSRERRVHFVTGWLIYGLVLCTSFVGMYLVYSKPHADAASPLQELESWSKTFPDVARFWTLPLWFYHTHTGPMFAYPQGGSPPGSVATFALFVLGCLSTWRAGRRELLLLLLAPFLMTFVAAAMKAYPYGGSARVALHLAPAICLLAGAGLSAVLDRFWKGAARRRATVVATLFFAIFPLGGIIEAVARPYKSEFVRTCNTAVRALADRASPDDRWVLYNARDRVAWAPYLGDWRGVGGQFVFDALRFAPVSVLWSPDPSTIPTAPSGRVWLLAYKSVRRKVNFNEQQLEDYAKAMSVSLGQPTRESIIVREEPDKREFIEIFVFGAR